MNEFSLSHSHLHLLRKGFSFFFIRFNARLHCFQSPPYMCTRVYSSSSSYHVKSILRRRLFVGEEFSALFSFQNMGKFPVRSLSAHVVVELPSGGRMVLLDSNSFIPRDVPAENAASSLVTVPLSQAGEYMFARDSPRFSSCHQCHLLLLFFHLLLLSDWWWKECYVGTFPL